MGEGPSRFGLMAGALVAASLAFAAPAHAVNRFAHPAGTGGPPCTVASPPAAVCNLQNALGISVTPGDDLTLLGSAYSAAGTLSVQSGVTVHGAPGARPLISSSAQPSLSITGGTLADVTLVQTSGTFPALMMDPGIAERVYVKTSTAGTACSVSATSAGLSRIRDSVCWNAKPGGSGIAGNAANGAQNLNLTLRNVTAIGQGAGSVGFGAGAFTAGSAHVVATNVIASGAIDVQASNGMGGEIADIDLDHSNYDTRLQSLPNASVTDPNTAANVLTPPAFVDAANGDFRQTTASLGTIDLGTAGVVNMIGLGPFDLDGEPRTQGALPDIGADEGAIFVPSPSSTAAPTAAPASTAPKKCKKGRKLKRGKCVKKKKKK